jgi:hypothetical protein
MKGLAQGQDRASAGPPGKGHSSSSIRPLSFLDIPRTHWGHLPGNSLPLPSKAHRPLHLRPTGTRRTRSPSRTFHLRSRFETTSGEATRSLYVLRYLT